MKERVLDLRRNGGDTSQIKPELVNVRRGTNNVESFRFFCHNVTNKYIHLFITTKIVNIHKANMFRALLTHHQGLYVHGLENI